MRRYRQSYGKGWKPYDGEFKVTKLNTVKEVNIPHKQAQEFYLSEDWKNCRKEFYLNLKEHKCANCGWTRDSHYNKKGYFCVDHVLPVRIFWEKRLLQSNLQLLCNICNQEKGNEYRVEYDV